MESESGLTVEKHLIICEQMNMDPMKDMPLTAADFPEEVDLAVNLMTFLNDNWDGSSGLYLGKDWSFWEYLIEEYKVEDPKVILFFAKMYESTLMDYRHKRAEQQRKDAERKAKRGTNTAKSTGSR